MVGRVEVITGPERRRRWSDEEKLQLVEEACRPGMSVSLVARQRGINASQLFAWRRQALANGRVVDNRAEPGAARGLTFTPVEVATDPAMADVGGQAQPARRRRGTKASGAIEVELKSGDRVRIEGCADASLVARILSVLRRA
jgi:transposase